MTTKWSPAHQDLVLSRYARRRGISLGRKGFAGYALYAAPAETWGFASIVVEGRGPEAHPVRVGYTYGAPYGAVPLGMRRHGLGSRHQAFGRALDLYLRLTKRLDAASKSP